MTDVVAKQADRHDASGVYLFEVAREVADELAFWSEPVRIKFERGKDGRMWLLFRLVSEESG